MRWLSDDALNRLQMVSRLPDLETTGYRLLERIGQGGMGVVYRAEDPKLGREVALKVLDAPAASDELAARLVREAKVLARLEHPGIVPVHDVGVLEDGRLFYTMKLVRGQRLDEYLYAPHALSDRLRVFTRICEAVAFAHDRGVLHRDLKPANIMVGAFGEVLVMDWGVAKVLGGGLAANAPASQPTGERSRDDARRTDESGLTDVGTVIGTRGYMAPEQARGEKGLDERADIYALGAVLAFVLANEEVGSEATTLALPEGGELPTVAAPATLPRRLAAIVAKAQAVDREERYADVQELVADVERFLDDGTVSALPESVWTRSARFLSRHRVAVVLILVYAIVRTLVLLFAGR